MNAFDCLARLYNSVSERVSNLFTTTYYTVVKTEKLRTSLLSFRCIGSDATAFRQTAISLFLLFRNNEHAVRM